MQYLSVFLRFFSGKGKKAVLMFFRETEKAGIKRKNQIYYNKAITKRKSKKENRKSNNKGTKEGGITWHSIVRSE